MVHQFPGGIKKLQIGFQNFYVGADGFTLGRRHGNLNDSTFLQGAF